MEIYAQNLFIKESPISATTNICRVYNKALLELGLEQFGENCSSR